VLNIKELLPQLHTFRLRYPKRNIDNQIIDDDHLEYLILKLQHDGNLKYVWVSYLLLYYLAFQSMSLPDKGYSRNIS
jgi:hypothetical protein